MSKSIFSLFLLFVGLHSVKAQNYLQAKDQVPYDVTMALEFLQLNSSSSKDWEPKIRKLDHLLTQLSEEERLMLLKAELHKAILKTSRHEMVQRPSYRPQTLKRLQENFKKRNVENWDPFSTYFIRALLADLTQIMQHADYPNFLNELRSNTNLSSQSRRFKQKLDRLLPWVQWYFEGSLPGLKQKLLQASGLALHLFNQRTKNLIFTTQFNIPEPGQEQALQFFEVSPIPATETTKKDETTKTPFDDSDAQTGSIPPKAPLDEKWVPKVAPQPEYQAPPNLPEPVDDWLPRPVNDWIDDM